MSFIILQDNLKFFVTLTNFCSDLIANAYKNKNIKTLRKYFFFEFQ